MPLVTYIKETKGLKPGKEDSSAWVRFHNGKMYLLPVIMRRQKFIPIFNNDESVGMRVESPDAELSPLVDSFFELIAAKEGNVIAIMAETYSRLLDLTRRLLLKNYDLSNEELIALLTMSNVQVKSLVENLLAHLRTA